MRSIKLHWMVEVEKNTICIVKKQRYFFEVREKHRQTDALSDKLVFVTVYE
jgi:hypothetical protein